MDNLYNLIGITTVTTVIGEKVTHNDTYHYVSKTGVLVVRSSQGGNVASYPEGHWVAVKTDEVYCK